jgi:hypothetical protein
MRFEKTALPGRVIKLREAHPDALASGNGGSRALQGPELTAQISKGFTGCGKSAFRNKKHTSGAKAHCKQNTCSTAEAVPLSKTGFFRSLFSPGPFAYAGKEPGAEAPFLSSPLFSGLKATAPSTRRR